MIASSTRLVNCRSARSSREKRLLPLGVAALLLLGAACTRPAATLISVRQERSASGTRLTLIGAPGARINARLPPSLERQDGTVLRFGEAGVTPDSNYFSRPPVLQVPGDPAGLIRASVCPEGEAVCRRVEVRLPS